MSSSCRASPKPERVEALAQPPSLPSVQVRGWTTAVRELKVPPLVARAAQSARAFLGSAPEASGREWEDAERECACLDTTGLRGATGRRCGPLTGRDLQHHDRPACRSRRHHGPCLRARPFCCFRSYVHDRCLRSKGKGANIASHAQSTWLSGQERTITTRAIELRSKILYGQPTFGFIRAGPREAAAGAEGEAAPAGGRR